MWTIYEPWQLGQLQRLGTLDPERVETFLNSLWNSYPGLLADLAIAAVDQEELSIDCCASLLDISPQNVEERLIAFRQRHVRVDRAVVVDGGNQIARLAEGHVPVWEVVRVYRKLGSVERLTEAFPSISTSELAAALAYANDNKAEIEDQINRYEQKLTHRRHENPFGT